MEPAPAQAQALLWVKVATGSDWEPGPGLAQGAAGARDCPLACRREQTTARLWAWVLASELVRDQTTASASARDQTKAHQPVMARSRRLDPAAATDVAALAAGAIQHRPRPDRKRTAGTLLVELEALGLEGQLAPEPILEVQMVRKTGSRAVRVHRRQPTEAE